MEKPILFNDDMVRAILRGEKRQTRRIIKPQPKSCLSYVCLGTHAGKWNYAPEGATTISGWPKKYSLASVPQRERENLWTPPCRGGDVLYVREVCRPALTMEDEDGIEYRADHAVFSAEVEYRASGCPHERRNEAFNWNARCECSRGADGENNAPWIPSIHMPKWAARIWLQVDNVSCQRLREITEKEAADDAGVALTDDPLDRFFDAWRKCYGEASIGENPWVWVISFHPIKR